MGVDSPKEDDQQSQAPIFMPSLQFSGESAHTLFNIVNEPTNNIRATRCTTADSPPLDADPTNRWVPPAPNIWGTLSEENVMKMDDSVPSSVGLGTEEPTWSRYQQTKLDGQIKQLNEEGSDNCSVTIGDAKLTFPCIKRLISTPGEEPRELWLDDETINGMTGVIASRWTRNDDKIVYMNSHAVNLLYHLMFHSGQFQHYTREQRKSSFNRAVVKSSIMRTGQLVSLRESSVVFAPALLDGQHWIGVILRRDVRKAFLLDSGGQSNRLEAQRTVKALSALMRTIDAQDGPSGSYDIEEIDFPKQENGFDCGMFVILAAYALASGRRPCVKPDSIQRWRKWVATTLLEEGLRS